MMRGIFDWDPRTSNAWRTSAKIATILGHRESVQERSLGIRERHLRFADPCLFETEEPLGFHADASVPNAAHAKHVLNLTSAGPRARLRGSRGLGRGQDENRLGSLFSQTVVVERRPGADRGRSNQAHGNLELVCRGDAR